MHNGQDTTIQPRLPKRSNCPYFIQNLNLMINHLISGFYQMYIYWGILVNYYATYAETIVFQQNYFSTIFIPNTLYLIPFTFSQAKQSSRRSISILTICIVVKLFSTKGESTKQITFAREPY